MEQMGLFSMVCLCVFVLERTEQTNEIGVKLQRA